MEVCKFTAAASIIRASLRHDHDPGGGSTAPPGANGVGDGLPTTGGLTLIGGCAVCPVTAPGGGCESLGAPVIGVDGTTPVTLIDKVGGWFTVGVRVTVREGVKLGVMEGMIDAGGKLIGWVGFWNKTVAVAKPGSSTGPTGCRVRTIV